ncbi:hypothetical protein [Xanthomonas axonopodis]
MKKILPNLDAALEVIHQPGHRNERAKSKATAPRAGDEPERETYFDLSVHEKTDDEPCVWIEQDARLGDYRTATGTRTNRSMITVPPKVRQNIREALGGDDQPWTTGLIALAEYGALTLKQQNKILVVEAAMRTKGGGK